MQVLNDFVASLPEHYVKLKESKQEAIQPQTFANPEQAFQTVRLVLKDIHEHMERTKSLKNLIEQAFSKFSEDKNLNQKPKEQSGCFDFRYHIDLLKKLVETGTDLETEHKSFENSLAKIFNQLLAPLQLVMSEKKVQHINTQFLSKNTLKERVDFVIDKIKTLGVAGNELKLNLERMNEELKEEVKGETSKLKVEKAQQDERIDGLNQEIKKLNEELEELKKKLEQEYESNKDCNKELT